MHLIALFFRMPWFGYLIIAGLIAYFGYSQTDTVNQRIAEIEAAIARPAPEPVPLDQYTRPEARFAEGGFIAQIVVDETVRLVDKKNGITTNTDYLVVLADPSATEDTRHFRALMIMDKREHELYEDWAYAHLVDFGELGPIVAFAGAVSHHDGEASHAKDALTDRGLTLASPTLYITPHFKGREAALAAALNSAENTIGGFNMIAAVVALIGIGKLLIGRRARQIRARQDGGPVMAPEHEPAIRSA